MPANERATLIAYHDDDYAVRLTSHICRHNVEISVLSYNDCFDLFRFINSGNEHTPHKLKDRLYAG